MRRILFIYISVFCIITSLAQTKGGLDTIRFDPLVKDFSWKVKVNHDYSHTLVGKLFLCQSLFDDKFKMKDNGRKEMRMNLDEACEAIKYMDALTLGMPKVIYLVGWQYNGHDSKYPAWFEGNTSLTRTGDKDPLESIAWLMNEGKKFHTDVSLHVNMFDCYEDSPLFEEYKEKDVLARAEDGSYRIGDWGYKISYSEEFKKGLAQKRIDSLCRILPLAKSGTIHVDAFHTSVPTPIVKEDGSFTIKMVSPIDPYHGNTQEDDIKAHHNIIKYFSDKGLDVTAEGFYESYTEYVPMVWHYDRPHLFMKLTAQQFCGGDTGGPYGKIFGQVSSIEEIFRDTTKSLTQRANIFKEQFCMTALQRDFLNSHDRQLLIVDKNNPDNLTAVFSDDVRSTLTEGRFMVTQGDAVLVDGDDELLPAGWKEGKHMIAFSRNGFSERIWTLPLGYPQSGKVIMYEVTINGERKIGTTQIKDGKVKISVKPGQMLHLKF